MPRLESEPTHSSIYRSGKNGALQARGFGGVDATSKLDDNKGLRYVPRKKSEVKAIIEEQQRQNQRVTGGVEDAVFNGTEYVPHRIT